MARRAALVVLLATLAAPAAAQGFGLQAQFADDGVNCCGEVVIFNGLALNANGDVWTSIGPRGTLDRYTTGGAQQASIPMGDVSHGIAVDHVHDTIYGVYGHLHGGYGIKKFALDGTPLLTFGTTSFTGDFNEGIAVAVNETTQETYGVGAGSGGKIVRFAADGSVVRTILPGVHPQDIEVDQATGNVYVVNYDDSTVVRYDAALDNRTVVYTGTGTHTNPFGLSLTGDGGFWVTWRGDGTAQRIAANGTSLGIASIPGQVMDVESDDHGGAWVSTGDGHTVRYVGTDPPAASFTTSHTGAVSRGTRVDFTSTATDPDGTIASTTWDLDDDGTYGDAIGATAGRTFATAGSFVVRMRVTDNDGATGVASTTVTVVDGAPSPSFTISPTAPRPGDTVTLASTSTDDGSITATDWDLDDDGQFDDGTGSPVTTSFATPGTHHVRLRVMDDAFNQVTLDRAIVIDPDPTELSASDATVTEGNAGTAQLSFHVTLAAPSGHPVTVDYVVEPGTAADGTDFLSRSLTSLTFAPGQTSKTIKVPVLGDVVDEADETVLLHLSDPDGATLADATGTGTITDDDAAPLVSVQDAQVTEGAGAVAHVTVSLSGSATERTADVHLTTSDGTAMAGSDYTAVGRDAAIVPPARSVTVDVPIANDDAVEPDETAGLTLTNNGPVPLGTTTAVLTIRDDDGPLAVVSAPPNPVSETGGPVTAVVRIPSPQGAPITLGWHLDGGDTSQSTDWAVTSGTALIPTGETHAAITMQPVDDQTDEADVEPWVLTVSVASGPASGTLTLPVGVTDDDPDAEPVVCPACEHTRGNPLEVLERITLPDAGRPQLPFAFDRASEVLSDATWHPQRSIAGSLCNAKGWLCRDAVGPPYTGVNGDPLPPIQFANVLGRAWAGTESHVPASFSISGLSGNMPVPTLVNPDAVGVPADADLRIDGLVEYTSHGRREVRPITIIRRFGNPPSDLLRARFYGPDPAYAGDFVACQAFYSWPIIWGSYRDGPITTGNGTTSIASGPYTVQRSDAGRTLHCTRSLAGHPTISVLRRDTPAGAATVTAAPVTVSSTGTAPTTVACAAGTRTCAGTLTYRAVAAVTRRRAVATGAGTTSSRRKGTVLGRATFRAKGRKAKAKVKLNQTGLARLRKTGSLSVVAVVATGSKVSDRAIVLSAAAPK